MSTDASDHENANGSSREDDAQQPSVTETASHPPDHRRPGEGMPERVGSYEILDVLGEGGMGVVYLAEQTKPIHRRVALKIIKLGMDTKQVIARFETERQALAMMNHPNVARIFEAGSTEEGRPYFVMEHVEGIPITRYCDERRLNTEERLTLFTQVCQAIQHAHQKGIIHRDIKPSNVLVAGQNGQAVSKVIDFGVAKATERHLTERTLFTEQGQLIGTPAYMSPEQADAGTFDIDTRTDVYSLGVLLYELLVGARPFDDQMLRNAALAEIQRIIRQVEPPKPSTRLSGLSDESTTFAQNRRTDPRTLIRQIRGDLDWIVMKCLEKDRTRRYDTANELALEIDRYLKKEPVLAGPPSASYRLRKFVRRNKGPVAAGVAVAVVLLGGLVGTSYGLAKAVRAREAEAKQRRIAEESERASVAAREEAEAVTTFLTDTLSSVSPEEQGKDVTVREVLDKAAEQIGESFAGKPLIEARVRQAIANTYGGLGLYDQMEKHAAEATAICQRTLGPRDPRTLAMARGLASSLTLRGEYSAAEAYARATLEVTRRVRGEEHQETLALMNALALTLTEQGKYTEAEALHRRTLDISSRVLGAEDPDTVTSMNNLAIVLNGQGKYAEAESLYRRLLDIRRRVQGEEHPATLNAMNNLVVALFHQPEPEKHAEGRKLNRQTLEIRRRVLGEEHPETLNSMSNLAVALDNKAEAEDLFRSVLEIQRRTLGEEHPRTLGSMNNVAWTMVDQGKYAEAEALQRRALEISGRVLGEEHPETQRSLNNLAIMLSKQDKYTEAEDLFRRTYEINRRTEGQEHPFTLLCMNFLAEVLHKSGKTEESKSLYREAIEVRRVRAEQEGASADDLRAYAFLLLSCDVEDLRDPRAALPPAKRAVELSGEKNANMLDTLANAYYANGNIDEAVATQRKALALLPPDQMLGRIDGETRLGAYLIEQGLSRARPDAPGEHAQQAPACFAEGETLLLAAYESLTRREYVPRDKLQKCVERLVKLYESWEGAEPGKGYADKADKYRAMLENDE